MSLRSRVRSAATQRNEPRHRAISLEAVEALLGIEQRGASQPSCRHASASHGEREVPDRASGREATLLVNSSKPPMSDAAAPGILLQTAVKRIELT